MKKLSFTLLLTFLLVALFATSTLAVRDNANKTGQGETFEEIVKTIGMLNNNGEGNVIFDHAERTDQKVHGSYQNNTNSCASCHQTHAGSARQMLFTDKSATCAACHDGTLGFYDVFATGKAYFNSSSTAGTFGGDEERNASAHNVGGGILIKAAPGGNPNGTGSWAGEFTCASCHAPHGSYSDRLLHYNPNNMANTAVVDGGNKQVNIPIVAGAGTGYHMRINGQEMKLYNGNNVVNTPWLSTGFAFRTNTGTTGTNQLTVDFRGAKATVNDEANVENFIGGTADIPVVYQVTLPKDASYVSTITNLDWKHNVNATRSNGGAQLNAFCASCHQDYVKGRTGQSTFDPTKDLFGHSINTGTRSCVSCHYSHGNDVEIMVDAQSRTVFDLVEEKGWDLEKAKDYMEDKNDSSALKKWTNMTGCFACHNSSRNTYFTNQTPSAEQPSGYVQDPSTKKYPTND